MKLPNFLIHTFAAVGVISLIFWSCAAADSDSIDNPPQLTGGTYQVEHVDDIGNRIVVLNTETGVMKTYNRGGSEWVESGFNTITFTH
jgi:hypothetical protein